MSTTVVQRNLESDQFVWDVNTMAWVKMTQPLIDGGSVIISGAPPLAVTGSVQILAVRPDLAVDGVRMTTDGALLNSLVATTVPTATTSLNAVSRGSAGTTHGSAIDVTGYSTCLLSFAEVTLNAAAQGRVTIEGTFDGSTYIPISIYVFDSNSYFSGGTANIGVGVSNLDVTLFVGLFRVQCEGLSSIRANLVWSGSGVSGTWTAIGLPCVMPLSQNIVSIDSAGNDVAIDQSIPGTSNLVTLGPGSYSVVSGQATGFFGIPIPIPVNVTGGTPSDNGGPNVTVGGVTNDGTPDSKPLPLGPSGRSVLTETVIASTATLSNVNDTASSTTLLAANSSRRGASIHNDSTSTLYVKLGTSASLTSFTVRLAPQGYYEVPSSYTGRIDGIWDVDASGAARITEITT